jgi:hypothetical protein
MGPTLGPRPYRSQNTPCPRLRPMPPFNRPWVGTLESVARRVSAVVPGRRQSPTYGRLDATFFFFLTESWIERAIIAERIRAGLARAKGEGKQLGSASTSPRTGRTHQEGPNRTWKAGRAGDRRAVRDQPWHRAADQPPFRRKRRRGAPRAENHMDGPPAKGDTFCLKSYERKTVWSRT